MDHLKNIHDRIHAIDSQMRGTPGTIYLNQVHNEFITLPDAMEIPRLPVKGLNHELSSQIIRHLTEFVPEFLFNHEYVNADNPSTDPYSIIFLRKLRGKSLNFVHVLKFDLMFGGDYSNVIERGDTDYFPSYRTSRLYFKSKIIPVLEASITDFKPARLKEYDLIDSDFHFYTFALFEEPGSREESKGLCRQLGPDIFPISIDLYQFISYDYLTATLNVLYPDTAELAAGTALFEPLFIVLYSRYRPVEGLVRSDLIREKFKGEIMVGNNLLSWTAGYIDAIKDYFGRFSLHSDEELMLKGWRRFEIRDRSAYLSGNGRLIIGE